MTTAPLKRCWEMLPRLVRKRVWWQTPLFGSDLIIPIPPVPCAPTNVSVSVDCRHDSARFNWTLSIGAIFYIAIAEDVDGNTHSCYSMGTNCLMEGLRCGQNYRGSIIGTNLNCNSSASEVVTFTTGTSTAGRVHNFTGCFHSTMLLLPQVLVLQPTLRHSETATPTVPWSSGRTISPRAFTRRP